jgi:hypothetical protein
MVTLSLAEDSTTLRPHSTMSKMLEGDPKSQCRVQETERWKDEFILDHDGWVEFCVVSCILALNIFLLICSDLVEIIHGCGCDV